MYIDTVTRQLEAAKGRNQVMEEEIEILKQTQNQSSLEQENLQKEVVKLQKEVERLQKEVERLQKEKSELQAKVKC